MNKSAPDKVAICRIFLVKDKRDDEVLTNELPLAGFLQEELLVNDVKGDTQHGPSEYLFQIVAR